MIRFGRNLCTKRSLPVIVSTAPMPIRVAIVGSSVGLATPIFATLGVSNLWYSYMAKSNVGKLAKIVVGFIIGGGGIKLIYDEVLPFFNHHSQFILPFALTNAVVSSFWYTIGELSLGMEFMTGMRSIDSAKISSFPKLLKLLKGKPIGGPMVGILTAITVPLLWPMAFERCWTKEYFALVMKDDVHWITDIYLWLLVPIAIPVAALAGLPMHYALRSVVAGVPGRAWQQHSLPALAAILAAAAGYFTYFSTVHEDYLWELRLSHSTGKYYSYNPATQTSATGIALYKEAETRRRVMDSFHSVRSAARTVTTFCNQWRHVTLLSDDPNDHILRSSSTDDDRAEKLVSGSEALTPSMTAARMSVYSVVDMLVRLKHLQLCLSACSDIAEREKLLRTIADLNAVAWSVLNIKDLAKLLKSCEELLMRNHRRTTGDLSDEQLVQVQQRDRADLLKSVHKPGRFQDKATQSDLDRIIVGERAVKLLAANMSILEIELQDKLKFDLKEMSEQPGQKDWLWSSWSPQLALATSVAAASIVALPLLFR